MAKRHKNLNGIHNALDNEDFLLDFFRTGYELECTLVFPQNDATEEILAAVLDENGWENLTSLGEGMPDFVNESRGLMIEVMRVDDHEQRAGFNPLRQNEGKILKDEDGRLRGMMDAFGADRASDLLMITHTELPTEEDHNYRYYIEAFRRIVRKHALKTQEYRKFNPGKQLIFLVFDESTAYFYASGKYEGLRASDMIMGQPHWFFLDSLFLDVIHDCGADYFLWVAPYKHAWFADKTHLNLPKACVFNCAELDLPSMFYDPARMVSTEE